MLLKLDWDSNVVWKRDLAAHHQTRTVGVFDLAKHKAVAVKAAGGVTIVMDGPGPALRRPG